MLLRCICGLVPTYEGQIWIEGLLATSTGRTNTDMGVIIETPGFLHNQTGFQNLKLLASIKNRITDAEIRRAIETVGLDADMKKKVGKYSLGMRQRLAIAQAIMENPPILLLDEPFSALDETLKEQLLNETKKKLVEYQKKCLFVTHSPKEMEMMCDNKLKIKRGRLE